MKNNNFFRMGMLAMVLAFGMTVIGCPTDTPEGENETLSELPSSTGTNELSDKTYQSHSQKWEFSANGTYRYTREEEDVWTVEETGNYSWDSSGAFKTVTLAPQRATVDGSTLYDKAAWKAAARNALAAEGLTEAYVAEMTEGQYTTITAFINAYADYKFALQLCNYTMSGEAIGTFVEMGTYGDANAKGGKVVVQNDTTGTLTVKTYDSTVATVATTVSASESKQVFSSGTDTFLTEIEIATTGNITEVEIKESFFSGSGHRFSGTSSVETGPICIGSGRTIIITVK
jgi:hypothetical protein